MPWTPQSEDDFPTLGWMFVDFCEDTLIAPSKGSPSPLILTTEQVQFALEWYELDPLSGRFLYQHGSLNRSRGWGKSPFLAALSCFEALGDCVFDGWDAAGQPVAKPWHEVRTPLVQVVAVSEEQTANTWLPLLEMLRDGPATDLYPGLEPYDSYVVLPHGGRIETRTAAGRSIKGSPPNFAVMDQTEEWIPSNGGVRLAQVMKANAAKVGGRTMESPNAYFPGEKSVAENTAAAHRLQQEGRTREKTFVLVDHREAPASTDMSDRDSLYEGLRYVYGDSSADPRGCVLHDPPCDPGWVDLNNVVTLMLDPSTDPQVNRSDFLNQITHASDSWLSGPEWNAAKQDDRIVSPTEPIVLGFDGSRGRVKGKADATALVAICVEDGYVFPIRIWEAREGEKDWTAPVDAVNATVDSTFADYNVVALYADPSGWAEFVRTWGTKHLKSLKIKASREAPCAAWPNGKNADFKRNVEEARSAIASGDLTHSGDSHLTSHVLNARRRNSRNGYSIYKEHPNSQNKIDGAVAMVNAYAAYLAAKGKKTEELFKRPKKKGALFI